MGKKKEKLYHSYPNSESICLSAKRNVHIANLKKNIVSMFAIGSDLAVADLNNNS